MRVTEPTSCPELEIGLHRAQADSCQLELRFTDPASDAEPAPVRTACALDPDALLPLQLEPLPYGQALAEQLFSAPEAGDWLGKVKAGVQSTDRQLLLRLLIGPTAAELALGYCSRKMPKPLETMPCYPVKPGGDNQMSTQHQPHVFSEPADEMDTEDTRSDSAPIKPWDPKKIRITTKNFTLREVVDQIQENEIDLAPDFQRDFVWKQRQRTRLVESILLGIPLPAFYFNQDRDGTYQVVDGVQRLTTIRRFMAGDHKLDKTDLEYLRELDGLGFPDLEPVLQRRIRSTQIVVHIIEPQTPEEIKYDIFGRVNTLGAPLSAQEIRHAMSKDRSRRFLSDLVHLESFDKATGFYFGGGPGRDARDVRDSKRMTNRELALRFCAFRDFSAVEYRRYQNLDAYLVEFTRRIDQRDAAGAALTDAMLNTLEEAFDRAMKNAYAILGEEAFRRWNPQTPRRGPLNRAVFEAQGIALSHYSLKQLKPCGIRLRKALLEAFLKPEYVRAVTVGTGDSVAIERRLSMTRSLVQEALS